MDRTVTLQPATTIDPQTHMGAVALVVRDLARSLDYYETRIGLRRLAQEGGRATLGVVDGGAERELLHLVEQPGAKPVARGHAGLYHFALLLPSRAALGRTLVHLAQSGTGLDGASDHGVSEALYLTDPDGHGIELYRDRPRAEWPYTAEGGLAMTLDPLDAEGLVAAGAGTAWQGLEAETVMGHVHLHVAALAAAEQFYVDTVGFALQQRFGAQADFVAAGGYHHHLGLNIWAGQGAPPPPEDHARLLWFEVVLPSAPALDEVLGRLQRRGIGAVAQEAGWFVRDPAGNGLRLRVASAAAAA